jgi:hypothetical protein
MVGAVQALEGTIVAIHRTWLRIDGCGKAALDPPKASLGPVRSGAVRFAKPAERLALAEGIETALSVAQACPDLPVWCALSASNISLVELPGMVREVVLCVDADAAGDKAARKAIARFLRDGCRVRVARPPAGADFNDVLTGLSR